mmetsp:Transcript_4045/g.16907  ORF Transcript_4045/g.16907 Transcript_4045/m.16907 type:complete len:244 (-) Transcript_4045:1120-1851(-)
MPGAGGRNSAAARRIPHAEGEPHGANKCRAAHGDGDSIRRPVLEHHDDDNQAVGGNPPRAVVPALTAPLARGRSRAWPHGHHLHVLGAPGGRHPRRGGAPKGDSEARSRRERGPQPDAQLRSARGSQPSPRAARHGRAYGGLHHRCDGERGARNARGPCAARHLRHAQEGRRDAAVHVPGDRAAGVRPAGPDQAQERQALRRAAGQPGVQHALRGRGAPCGDGGPGCARRVARGSGRAPVPPQ